MTPGVACGTGGMWTNLPNNPEGGLNIEFKKTPLRSRFPHFSPSDCYYSLILVKTIIIFLRIFGMTCFGIGATYL